jgi:hypothetical protein
MRGQLHTPAILYPWERPCTHCSVGWVGRRAGLDRCGKSHPPPGFNPWTIQPVASRYTNYATRPTVCSVSQLKTQLVHTALQSSYMCITLSQSPTPFCWISCILSLHCSKPHERLRNSRIATDKPLLSFIWFMKQG